VNYEARNFDVTRNMRGDEAKKKCPNIVLVHVPEVRGKADLTK
jgi:DNA polymerase eta